MTDGNSLLAAILADPADDTARLVYADWLQDDGNQPERAEFIRVQVELARIGDLSFADAMQLTGQPVSPNLADKWHQRNELRARERELWNESRLNGAPHPWFGQMGFKHTANWWTTYDKPKITIPMGRNRDRNFVFNISRGFISRVTCTAADWLRHADALRAAQPIQTVFLADWNGLLPPLWIAGDLTAEERWDTFTSERFKGILFRDLAGHGNL